MLFLMQTDGMEMLVTGELEILNMKLVQNLRIGASPMDMVFSLEPLLLSHMQFAEYFQELSLIK